MTWQQFAHLSPNIPKGQIRPFCQQSWAGNSKVNNACCCCCIGVLRPFGTFQVISGMVSFPIHTVPGQASCAVYQYVVHILSPKTDNCPSWISRRERMAIEKLNNAMWPSFKLEILPATCLKVQTSVTLDKCQTMTLICGADMFHAFTW